MAVAGLLALISGCAAVKKPHFEELLWPEPPQTPRIKFTGLLRNQQDLGRSAGELIAEALLGNSTPPESLWQPMGIAPSRDSRRVYVTDYAKPAVFVFDLEGRTVSMLGGENHPFETPLGIALDDRENVYVVDSTPRVVRVYDREGKFVRNITDDRLERPTGIAVDPSRGKIYVSDSATKASDNHVIHVFDMNGNYLRAFGGRGYEEGKFFFPTYLTVDDSGNLYVTDTMNARVQVFDAQGRYLKTIGERGDTFGMFDKPKGVAIDTFGNVYVVDSAWSNVQIFNQNGQVLLFFGSRGRFPGLLFNPTGIAIDAHNRIYVADAFNRRVGVYQLINTKAEDSYLALASEEHGSTGSSPEPGKAEEPGAEPAHLRAAPAPTTLGLEGKLAAADSRAEPTRPAPEEGSASIMPKRGDQSTTAQQRQEQGQTALMLEQRFHRRPTLERRFHGRR